jgi:hypothetical protein
MNNNHCFHYHSGRRYRPVSQRPPSSANLNKLQPNLNEQLLLNLAEKDNTARIVSSTIMEYSNLLPEDMRKQIPTRRKKGIA